MVRPLLLSGPGFLKKAASLQLSGCWHVCAMTPPLHSLLWFRKGLRLHDNPSLLKAIEGAERFYAVFCLDPWFIRPEAVGVNRLSFLLESLAGVHT